MIHVFKRAAIGVKLSISALSFFASAPDLVIKHLLSDRFVPNNNSVFNLLL